MKKSILPLCQKFEATNIFLLFGPIALCYFQTCENFFGINVIY